MFVILACLQVACGIGVRLLCLLITGVEQRAEQSVGVGKHWVGRGMTMRQVKGGCQCAQLTKYSRVYQSGPGAHGKSG
ncbi:hypothetical protein BGX38DRAFT_1187732 [Terfezia claveryi]|nr:hypothetical protein BGX38DRAFT_1187732 [Terfezia claveryi]